MSRRTKNIRKRARQKQRHAQRPQQVEKPIARVKTADLIADILRPLSSRAFDEVLKEIQHTKV
jgi:hypothetical protein